MMRLDSHFPPLYAATYRLSELAGLIREHPIVYVPAGIYEWHDEHNPLGTDTLKMIEIRRRAAVRTV